MSDHRWPLDRALELLRGHRLPYKQVNHNVWHSLCPSCRTPEWGLSIRECRRGGPIAMRCAAGCSKQRILTALLAEPVDERVEAALALAEDASRVAHQALELLLRQQSESREQRELSVVATQKRAA
jgi:hypothetical protein